MLFIYLNNNLKLFYYNSKRAIYDCNILSSYLMIFCIFIIIIIISLIRTNAAWTIKYMTEHTQRYKKYKKVGHNKQKSLLYVKHELGKVQKDTKKTDNTN